jgi:pimeloyl-ACP methyl ester carboxylesterase
MNGRHGVCFGSALALSTPNGGSAAKRTVEVDVTGVGDLPGPLQLMATLFTPDSPADTPSRGLIVALPGGGNTRSYFDITVPGYADYSFAAWMVERGFAVLAFDLLGQGESSRPSKDVSDKVTLETMADAQHLAVTRVAAALRGQLSESLDWPAENPTLIGIGHSMGGAVTVIQQGKHQTFDAIVTMGTTNFGVGKKHPDDPGPADPRDITLDAARAAGIERQKVHFPDSWDGGYLIRSANSLRPTHSHLDDVPTGLIDALEWCPVPRMASVDALSSKVAYSFAERVKRPVLLVYGERDTSKNPHEEVSVFHSSSDVMLFVLPQSAHMHNVSSSRHALWTRIDAWIRLLGTSRAFVASDRHSVRS